jgi:membrane protease YdiL (CAAX protease family)
MKNLIKDLLNWIKNPNDIPLNINLQAKFKLLVGILLIDILIAIAILGLVYFIHYNVIQLKQQLIDWNPSLLIFLAIIIAPLIEEILFRLPLKYERNYLVRLFDFLLGGWIKQRWHKWFKYFVWLLALAFGLIHLSNYENREPLFFWLAPIIVGSQLIGGLTLSYSRIKLGFKWSVIHHGMFNLFGVVIGLVFFHNVSIMNLSNNDYTFEITELMYINKESSSYDATIQNGITYLIKAQDINLQKVIDVLNEEEEKLYDDIWVDFYFESKEGIETKELIELMKKDIKFEQ